MGSHPTQDDCRILVGNCTAFIFLSSCTTQCTWHIPLFDEVSIYQGVHLPRSMNIEVWPRFKLNIITADLHNTILGGRNYVHQSVGTLLSAVF